jgi:GNAT superfamily N-acetyltransferase
MEIVELADNKSSRRVLSAFYRGVYSREFPDVDERESLENMVAYLRLKTEGWYGMNNYHIVILQDDAGNIAGGMVADYFERSNVGVIEFVVVAPELRGRGLGKLLLREISQRLEADSRRAGHAGLNGICAEVNDPYRRCDVQEHLDGFARLRIWDHFGFRLLDFPYVQPPLSSDQDAVVGLGLMFRPERAELARQVPSALVEHIVADYQIWAMRISEPDREPDFQRMQGWLRQRSSVGLIDMRAYVCEEAEPPFDIAEVRDGDDELITQFAEIYGKSFADEETAVEASEFTRGSRIAAEPVPHHYWLWVVRAPGDRQLVGLASFFSFPHCGFGGYAALSGGVQHKSRIQRFLRLMERQIVQANSVASGWYVECDPASTAARLAPRFGFAQVPMIYRQPRLHTDRTGVSEGKVLALFYKPFGRVYEVPVLSLAGLQRDLREILARIYYLDTGGVDSAMAKMTWPANRPENVFAGSERGWRPGPPAGAGGV